jgi:hypothetical protein
LFRAVEEEQSLAAQGKLIELDEAEKERAESENGCCRAMRDVSGRWVPIDAVILEDFEPTPVLRFGSRKCVTQFVTQLGFAVGKGMAKPDGRQLVSPA